MVHKEDNAKYIFYTSIIWCNQKECVNISLFFLFVFLATLWDLFCDVCFSLYVGSSHAHVFYLCSPWLVPLASSATPSLSPSIFFLPLTPGAPTLLSRHSEPSSPVSAAKLFKADGGPHTPSLLRCFLISCLSVDHQIQHIQKNL